MLIADVLIADVLGAAPAPMVEPQRGNFLDLVLLVLASSVAVAGFRRGFVVGVLSAGGFLAGVLLGVQLAPPLARALIGGQGRDPNAYDAVGQRFVALVLVVAFAVLVEVAGVALGLRIREAVQRTPGGVADAAAGAVFEVVAFLFVAWLVGSAVAVQPFPEAAGQVRRSLVLSAVDAVVPRGLQQLSADLNRFLQHHAMPYLLDPFGAVPLPAPALPPPDAGAVPPALRAAGPSVVKVTGIAEACRRGSAGSGFVFSSERVMTNAHVVAGVSEPVVALPAGGTLAARVVLYNPARDVAVLHVPGLRRPPLRFSDASAGAAAVVAGYPENGPLTAVPARVAGEQAVRGPDIYHDKRVTREVYTVRGRVLPGNSGGPLLSPSGLVYGVIFAASVERRDVGYALTADEVAPDARRGAAATVPVSTGPCN